MKRLVLLAVVLAPAVASAHITLTYPPPRHSDQKVGPCGKVGSVRGTPTVLAPGSMVEVRWTEPINHPSHYRISFDAEGTDFTVPPDYMDFSRTENVLADNIPDGAGPFSRMVQLPNTPCENCTLQLIQMMYDKTPYGNGDDIYFQCADIALRVGGAPPPPGGDPVGAGDAGVDPGPGDSEISGGCAIGAGAGAGHALWMVAMLAPLARRLRRRPR